VRRGCLLLVLALAACGGSEPAAVSAARGRPAPEAAAQLSPFPPPAVRVVQRGDGNLGIVPGDSAASGPGRPTTYVVQVEGGLGIDPVAFAAAVETTLADPRSWGADGRRAMRRVDDVDRAELRVTLASPRTTDRLCAPLDTGGYYSCANGSRAVLNAARWLEGAPSYAGRLEEYRAYVVNHEVGHALGFSHAPCAGRGQVAPVMLPQTKGLDGCTHGPWPYP
jgi:hypothetical protein